MSRKALFEDLPVLTKAEPDAEAGSHILTFTFDDVRVTIRVVLDDPQTGAQLLITHMTTLPRNKSRQGFGRKALRALLERAEELGFTHIRATQVQVPSFWTRNGFVGVFGSPTRDYVYVALP